ncbi:unnamed protein product [Acanthosepion pharaonis]|uniref:Uncharacterized protein n=1 Tax=Acanthosepion pharaonis TaxID=158019 RepID=A0A812BB09_ACAPH|nr:unnamed protein product [Sepia pharaonis]
MSFLGRRYRFCDGTCQQGYRLQARELLTANTPARLTHNSPASESDDNDDELVSYVPMNFFGEQGICSNSNLRIDKDQTQLPVTNVLEQFQLGEGDRKRESNKIVENAERPLDDGRIHVSGDVFQWSCTPPPTHGPAHIKGTTVATDSSQHHSYSHCLNYPPYFCIILVLLPIFNQNFLSFFHFVFLSYAVYFYSSYLNCFPSFFSSFIVLLF